MKKETRQNIAVVGWLITVLAGIVAPATVLVLIGSTPNTVLRSGTAGQFVSATASSGGVLSPGVTSVQTTTSTIIVYDTFSAPRRQPLVVRETLKGGLQLCAKGKSNTCVGVAGSWAGDMQPVPHVRHRLAGLVRGIGSRGASLWLMMGILLSIGVTGMAGQQIESTERKRGRVA